MAKNENVGLNYPTMQGQGYDPVEFPRENLYPPKGSLYGKGRPEIDAMQIREVPRFIKERLESAATDGHLAGTFNHYLKALEGAEVFDSQTLSNLKSFKKSVEGARDYEDQKAALKTVVKFLNGIRMQKR